MTNSQIKKTRIRLEKRITALYSEMTALKELCPHEDTKKTARSSTGNYDPSADSYWYECCCPDCGKLWTEPQ